MPIDTSMYANLKPAQVQLASPIEVAEGAMRLSQLGMQQMQMQRQFQTQNALRDAYANSIDQNGNIDRQALLSNLGKNPYTAPMQMDYQQKFAAADKAQADAQAAQMQATHQIYSVLTPKAGYLLSMPDDQAAKAYPQLRQQMIKEGVPEQYLPQDWDRGLAQQAYAMGSQLKEGLENQKTVAETRKTQEETAAIPQKINAEFAQKGAEELGKFNEDVNNASSRKTTGSLIDARNRADRILTLVGRKPDEPDQAYFSRLNQYMPQVGTEVGTSLAAIMQGGVPNEELQAKLSPDTMQSKLAELQQKWHAEPTAANQGKLLAAYADIAGKLRDFSSDRLQQITDRARSAYPYANQYFSKQMDKIAQPLLSPAGAQPSQASVAQGSNGGSGAGIPGVSSANAAEGAKKTLPPLSPGMIRIKAPDGKIYRIPKEQKGEAIAAGGTVVK